ncbi:hypothetical protein GGR50DRAFT_206711 [Xylaria sp. CBS 124048]|nr:hypothetical protein GGR50DRAFT_206711 [Xylaria sp. CBS 124048]
MASIALNHHQHTRSHSEASQALCLLTLLSNNLVLHRTIPYLPFPSVMNLAATSRFFHSLLHSTPSVFRHLDLTWFRLRSGLYGYNTLRHVFSSLQRQDILRDVKTLVLDGMFVSADFIHDILIDPVSRIRVLSIRQVRDLSEQKLMQALRYACRPTRPEGTPRLQALYYFGSQDYEDSGLVSAPVARQRNGEDWYGQQGKVDMYRFDAEWAETLLDCREILRFDAVLCTSPRHQNSAAFGKVPLKEPGARLCALATYAVGGCASCGSAPEGFTVYGETDPAGLPLLSPIPLHSSTVKAAMRPTPKTNEVNQRHEFIPRCMECIDKRICRDCGRWWCEACQPDQLRTWFGNLDPIGTSLAYIKAPMVMLDCWECEPKCLHCIAETQKYCRGCGGGYCIIHYEGSTQTLGALSVLPHDAEISIDVCL